MGEVRAQFLWRYWSVDSFATKAEFDTALHALENDPQFSAVVGGMLMVEDGSALKRAMPHFRAARKSRPDDLNNVVRLAVALAGSGHPMQAVKLLAPIAKKTATHPGILNTYAFLAAVNGGPDVTSSDVADALARAKELGGRDGAIAAVFEASIADRVPFKQAEAIFRVTRDLLFVPNSCAKRFYLAWVMRRLSVVPEAVAAGRDMLLSFTFECPNQASASSGMGLSWVEQPNQTHFGFGGDLQAVAHIRSGLKSGIYADWSLGKLRGVYKEANPLVSTTLNASKYVSELGQQTPRTCSTSEKPTIVKPSRRDPLGCPAVKASKFRQNCLKRHRPCVIRGVGAEFFRDGERSFKVQRWVKEVGNRTVKVSFPYPAVDNRSTATLNAIVRTTAFFGDDAVKSTLPLDAKVPSGSEHPFTLLRPASVHMRFQDLVEWIEKSPQEVYMNQEMLADIGPEALEMLRTPDFVETSPLQLLNPTLWLTSSKVTTGYHWDAPENLLVQMAGEKEVVVVRPSEDELLEYQSAPDVQAQMTVNPKTGAVIEGLDPNSIGRTSGGHSLINVASAALTAQFPRYNSSQAAVCHIGPGDVLYIPAFWHHAVATNPDEHCHGFSLNLWYMWDGKPPTFAAAAKMWAAAKDK